MKYRTVIELICDAADAEDAGNIAGDYLKGEIDFGVTMQCRTMSLRDHKLKRCAVSLLTAFFVFSIFLLKVTPMGDATKTQGKVQPVFQNTSTIMPVLKTQHKGAFKKVWEKKKDDAVMECLKGSD